MATNSVVTTKFLDKNLRTAVALRGGALFSCLLFMAAVSSPAKVPAEVASAQTLVPAVVSTRGYINPTPLRSHSTATFNTIGSTTMVAYVSSHPSWNGRPVSIIGLSDNAGNTWKKLEGPTLWVGSTVPLLSAMYYVNAPVTTDVHTVTVALTNPAPLVVHVVSVSGSDVTAAPQHSAIEGLTSGERSIDVATDAISVHDPVLLLAWTKNESIAHASALDGYTLDPNSTGFLWGEYKPVLAAGSYASHFQYDAAIGHQTAIVAIRASATPVASSQAFTTRRQTPINIELMALSPKRHPLTYRLVSRPAHGSISGTFPNLIYTPEADFVGEDTVVFKADDGTDQSNSAWIHIAVQPKSWIELIQENAMKIGSLSILMIALVCTRLRFKGYSPLRGFQVQAE